MDLYNKKLEGAHETHEVKESKPSLKDIKTFGKLYWFIIISISCSQAYFLFSYISLYIIFKIYSKINNIKYIF